MRRISFWHFLLVSGAILFSVSTAYANDKRDETVSLKQAKATFAGGCFWCMQSPFDKQEGVIKTTVGYIGGQKDNPSYQEVSAGSTGHAEAVEVIYDPSKVDYAKLLKIFWHNIDPLDGGGQFCDRGTQYRPAVFYHDEEQRRLAEESKAKLELDQPIATEIVPASSFFSAEAYHQSYYKKNPIRYKMYRRGCGRDKRLKQLWGK